MSIDEKVKKLKQKLGEKIPCSIEILTPVHIGSGVKLSEGIDFIKTDQSVHIVTQSELMKYLEQNQDELNNFIQGGYKLNALRKIPPGRNYFISMGRSSEINEFERNGMGKPYIPGSSLKGAIRTILLKKLFDELSNDEKNNLLNKVNNPKKEWAAEPIVKKLLGDDSNKNLMRVLEIFDAEFDTVDLVKVLILSLTNETGTSYGWKQLRNRKNTIDPNDASQVFCEVLPVGLKSYCSISLHNFLMNDPTANSTLGFNEDSLSDIKKLVKTINSYSNQKLNKEREFFENLTTPRNLTTVIMEIEKLIEDINNLSEDEFIIRISWGSGWKGMTGDFLDETWLTNFRRKYQLGKKDFPIFPKTRRIVFEDNEPKYLTGWIKVKLFDQKIDGAAIDTAEKLNNNQNPLDLLKQKYKVREGRKN